MMFSHVIVCINRTISEYFHRAKPNWVVQITVEPLNNSHTTEVLMSDDWPVQRWPMLGKVPPFFPLSLPRSKITFLQCVRLQYTFFFNCSSENLLNNQPIFLSPCYLACTWVEEMKGNSFLVTPGSERVIKSDKYGTEQLRNEVAVTFCREG